MTYKKKWYDNEAWLKMMYLTQGKQAHEIAAFAHISEETVRKLLIKYGLKRGR